MQTNTEAFHAPSLSELRLLLEQPTGARVTIQLAIPERPSFDDRGQQSKRYLALVAKAESELANMGIADAATHAKELRSLPLRYSLQPPGAASCVVLSGPQRQGLFHTRLRLDDEVRVGPSLGIRPLLAELHTNRAFRLLSLSEARVALYEGDRYALRALESPDVPADITEALGSEFGRTRRSTQVHSTGSTGRGSASHGHGGAPDSKQVDRERFYEHVARGVHKLWPESEVPVVLAAGATHLGRLREHLDLPGLLDQSIESDPDALTASELQQRGCAVVDRWRQARDSEAAEALAGPLAHGHATDELQTTTLAAAGGRVSRLWIDLDRRLEGHLDRKTGALSESTGTEDVLDQLAELVLETGGEVRVVSDVTLPTGRAWIAELRG